MHFLSGMHRKTECELSELRRRTGATSKSEKEIVGRRFGRQFKEGRFLIAPAVGNRRSLLKRWAIFCDECDR
jgi:hypothetical protein